MDPERWAQSLGAAAAYIERSRDRRKLACWCAKDNGVEKGFECREVSRGLTY